jgi:hypothetical protein
MRNSSRRLPLRGIFGALALALVLAHAPSARAQVAVDDSILLDPFDPVPEIQFRHFGGNGCFDGCFYREGCHDRCGRCYSGCRTRCWRDGCGRLHCSHGCRNWRGSWYRGVRGDDDFWHWRYDRDHDRFIRDHHRFRRDIRDYENRARDYDRNYRGGYWDSSYDRHDWHDGDRHDRYDGDRHDALRGHDGDGRDWHDGDHRDGRDWHDRNRNLPEARDTGANGDAYDDYSDYDDDDADDPDGDSPPAAQNSDDEPDRNGPGSPAAH